MIIKEVRGKPMNENKDVITITLSRDDCIGLTHIQLSNYLAMRLPVFQTIAEFALDRPIMHHEFIGLGPEVKEAWDDLLRRAKGSKN